MQQTEVVELFGPLIRHSTRRRRAADYATMILLLIVAVWWGYSAWLSNQVPRIESIKLAPNSTVVFGSADRVAPDGRLLFCPGDTMTVRYQLAVEGSGTIFADDVAHFHQRTVKFSSAWRDVVDTGTRSYDNEWVIPSRPDMAIEGQRAWLPGQYTRVISVAASNMYISRYVPPATIRAIFYIAENCP